MAGYIPGEKIKIVPILDESEINEYTKAGKFEIIGLYVTETENGPKINIGYPSVATYNQALGNMFGFYNKYSLGHDIFDIKENNIVVFPSGNWVNNKVYYNLSKQESYPISTEAISQEEIDTNTEYANKLLDVSNDIIVFNLLKKDEEE